MTKLAIVLVLLMPTALLAQEGARTPNEPGYTAPGAGRAKEPPKLNEQGQSFRGEVTGIDQSSGTVTLKHNSILALGVPAGTTEYPVKDDAMLKGVKVGQRVRFGAVLQGRSLLVTHIEPAN
jgi:Cu/Ag efflux protein CusF